MSVALIEPFDRWFLSLSKGSGTARRNDCYTKCGGFDKLNHRNANLLDSPFAICVFYTLCFYEFFFQEVKVKFWVKNVSAKKCIYTLFSFSLN